MPHTAKPLSGLWSIILVTTTILLLVACHKSIVLDPVISDPGFAQENIPLLPLTLPSDSSDAVYRSLRNPEGVMAFYRRMNYQPGWSSYEQPSLLADSLVHFIQNIRYYGLLPQSYHLGELTTRIFPAWKPEVLMRQDVLLTDAFLSIANDLKRGRTETGVPRYDSAAISLLIKVVTDSVLSTNLASVEPTFLQYQQLKKGLARMLEYADSANRSLLLQGLTLDSVPVHHQVRTIEINLDRWRREKTVWGDRYIFVNIPSFTLQVMDGDQAAFESRVIVGKPESATPELSSVVQCFVTYPYWRVPRKISIAELLPAIQRDTTFIRRNNFDVLDRRGKILNPDSVDWKRFNADYFPVVLRQREGPENSLGIIKFLFDNPYAVFIHDTNSRRLFRSTVRAFSHGCIRIEKATALGHYLATGERGKRCAVVENFLDQKLRHTVDLSEPMPVHIRYFTAVADRDGNIEFPHDVYGKDQQLIQLLYGRPFFITRAAD